MPITIKTGKLKYRKSNGTYDGFDAISNTTTEEQVATINLAGQVQTSVVEGAGATQITAIQNKGTEVLQSIPDTYEELSNNVDDLNNISFQLNQAATFDKTLVSWARGVLGTDNNGRPKTDPKSIYTVEFFLVDPGAVITFTGDLTNRLNTPYFYDINKNLIGTGTNTSPYNIPENTYFIRFAYRFTIVSGITIDTYEGGMEQMIEDWNISCRSKLKKDIDNCVSFAETQITALKGDLSANEIATIVTDGWITGRRMGTPEIGETFTDSPGSISSWQYIKLSCNPGDTFTINATGSSTFRTWAFADSALKCLARNTLENNASVSVNEVITAPDTAAWLYINQNADRGDCFVGRLLPGLLNQRVSYAEAQTLTDEQKAIARDNIGAAEQSTVSALSEAMTAMGDELTTRIEQAEIDINESVSYSVQQIKSDSQKAKARSNIDAAEKATELYSLQLRRAAVIEKALVKNWAQGSLNANTGKPSTSGRLIYTPDYYLVSPDMQIVFNGMKFDPDNINMLRFAYFYDADKNFINRSSSDTHTIPENAYYVRFAYGFASSSAYNVDSYGGIDAVAAKWNVESVSAIEKTLQNGIASTQSMQTSNSET